MTKGHDTEGKLEAQDMSINVARFVETTLKERTNIYSPLVEAIVNSIEAILETRRDDGRIIITPIRDKQTTLDSDILPEIVGFHVEDNGIGFDEKNRDAFDTLCTDYKKEQGGKGLGRFIFLKYFRKVTVKSVYRSNGGYRVREFRMGQKSEIIENQTDRETNATDTQTELLLDDLKERNFDKELSTIARRVMERILVFFVNDDFKCPEIVLKEGNKNIILNRFINNIEEIQHIHSDKFELKEIKGTSLKYNYEFRIEIYKILFPHNIISKICLTAHNRHVTETSLHKYIPEFKDDFIEVNEKTKVTKNYIVSAYVLGKYLNDSVSPERGSFNFPAEDKGDLLYPISRQGSSKLLVDLPLPLWYILTGTLEGR